MNPALLLFGLLLQAPGAPAAPAPASTDVLVMPFDVPDEASRAPWLGEGSAVLLAHFLEGYGASVVSREQRIRAFERLQLPPVAALSHATMIKIGQFVDAAEVIVGSYELAGDHLTVRARAIQLVAGRMSAEVIERGPLTDLFAIYDRAARRLTTAAATPPTRAAGTVWTTPHGFEMYVKGLMAMAPATQRDFLLQAAKAAPADDDVRIALWDAYTDLGEPERAMAAAAAVPPSSQRARAARYAMAHSQLALKRYEDAFTTLKALQSEARSAEVLNALGIVQLRRGGSAQSGRAVYFFNQATQLEPTDPDYFFNLGYGYFLDKDAPAAVYWLREALRRDPADGEAHLVLSAALQQTGAAAEAARERELAGRLSAGSGGLGEALPRGLERMKDRLDRSRRRVEATLSTAGQREQLELALFHLDNGRRAYRRDADREAEQELRRALYLSPYLGEAHVLLGRVYLRNGRISEAIQALKIAVWSEETAEGYVALAEALLAAQNTAAAREAVDRALQLDPASSEARSLRAKIAP